MKCRKCKNEKLRILGEEYCPHCLSKNFSIKNHSGENHIGENSIRAVLWGVTSSFLLSIFVIFFFRTFLSESDIPDFILIMIGFICFGSSGAITVFFDKNYYVKDNFIISLILSVAVSTIDWYLDSASYLMTFLSSLVIFFITISLGSLFYKVVINKE